ncbi:preprotein translocase subunit SecE [Tomitella fengzijianii]|uniref:Protein translocase subunit SecE n=1 Tax=Tomitella fengzijianii TaxID=2597660 RepID=A0A516X1P9_9ACTN|nr:preprotein translocase subunit SecE [Tomitella fengzijianii]QDQ96541.1 preprotein translocase subunit SecE [Tomitella fengzijianii]
MSDEQDMASGDARPSGKRGRADAVTTVPRPKVRKKPSSEGDASGKSRNPFSLMLRFLREVVTELKKVIWPTKQEWFTYTVVVLVFIVALIGLTTGLDIGFGKAVSVVFG